VFRPDIIFWFTLEFKFKFGWWWFCDGGWVVL